MGIPTSLSHGINLSAVQCNLWLSDYWFYPVLQDRDKVRPTFEYNYSEGRWHGWIRKRKQVKCWVFAARYWRRQQLCDTINQTAPRDASGILNKIAGALKTHQLHSIAEICDERL